MDILGGMVLVGALKAVGAFVLWVLMVLVLWRGAKVLKYTLRLFSTRRACERCGIWYMSPSRRFCGDCGGRVVKAA